MPDLEDLAVVALLQDLPEYGLARGQIGTVVMVYSPQDCEVEFCNEDGYTYALLTLKSDTLIRIHKDAPPEKRPGL